jgi:negative regulator of sigma E activity
MKTDDAELLSALIDREPVDPDALARALEDPEARPALVAFARVRAELHAPAPGESEWLAKARPPAAGPLKRHPWRLAAAAALVAAGVAAGVLAERYAAKDRPPSPTRVVQLEPMPVIRP